MEFTTNGIDRNELVKKIEKIDTYIRKAEQRLNNNETALEKLYAKEIGDKDEIETAMKVLKNTRSSQIR